MNKYIPEKIDRMTEYVPNKGDFSVRLDANESPYLPSEELRKRIEKAAFSAASPAFFARRSRRIERLDAPLISHTA